MKKITNKDVAEQMFKNEIMKRSEFQHDMFKVLSASELIKLLNALNNWKTDEEYVYEMLYKYGISRVNRNKEIFKTRIEFFNDRIKHFENLIKISEHAESEIKKTKEELEKTNEELEKEMLDDLPF